VRLNGSVRFSLEEWPSAPPLFSHFADLGNIAPTEMYQTFNMGIGFVLALRPGEVDRALARLRRAGVRDARPLGRVTDGRGVELPQFGLRYEGYA
jgi:phosphoribosylformylglycinamidine cyclo-ligase